MRALATTHPTIWQYLAQFIVPFLLSWPEECKCTDLWINNFLSKTDILTWSTSRCYHALPTVLTSNIESVTSLRSFPNTSRFCIFQQRLPISVDMPGRYREFICPWLWADDDQRRLFVVLVKVVDGSLQWQHVWGMCLVLSLAILTTYHILSSTIIRIPMHDIYLAETSPFLGLFLCEVSALSEPLGFPS